ncbi:hypothetical protein B296_00004040 [Ensete ventricosum]|uniref:Uncharacterized protein n=1 Tax=Ensete ventricosum TaxID=4639 RepID=A0A427A464_ENSVE|nr:hypothetical protein B296_00004040 [Ensete ventricosum]
MGRTMASKKRKASAAVARDEEASTSGGSKSPEELLKESNKGAARGKRVKAAKPKPEPEYFPEKRNMEDLWQAAFPVGTEVSQMLAVNGEEKVVLIPVVVAVSSAMSETCQSQVDRLKTQIFTIGCSQRR